MPPDIIALDPREVSVIIGGQTVNAFVGDVVLSLPPCELNLFSACDRADKDCTQCDQLLKAFKRTLEAHGVTDEIERLEVDKVRKRINAMLTAPVKSLCVEGKLVFTKTPTE